VGKLVKGKGEHKGDESGDDGGNREVEDHREIA
jgi:hypothetical protein